MLPARRSLANSPEVSQTRFKQFSTVRMTTSKSYDYLNRLTMKTCSYCGKDYPDEILICPSDQQPLGGPGELHQGISGMWQGSYNYFGNSEADVPFTLQLEPDALGHFTGTVTEDVNLGMPGTGSVEGTVAFPRIEFVKRMPVCYVVGSDGQLLKLREWAASQDLVCEGDLPHPPVVYQGEFIGNDEARGKWVIEPWEVPLADGMALQMGKASGSWVIRATGDLGRQPEA